MPRAPSSSIHKLVRSLSSSEKRYFTLYAQLPIGKESKKCIQLFRILEKQKSYDETAAMEELAEINQKAFSDLKAYLSQLVLKSLRGFHEGTSADLKVKAALIDAEILLNKGLTSECRKTLAKAMKVARLADNITLELEILKWELKTLISWAKPKELKIFKQQKQAEIDNCIQRLADEQQYVKLYAQFDELFASIQYRVDRKQIEPLMEFGQHTLLSDSQRAESFKARLFQLLMNYQCKRFTDDSSSSYGYARQLVQHFESNPNQLKINQRAYLTCINYLLEELQKSNDWLNYEEILQRLKNRDFSHLDVSHKPIEAHLFNLYNYYQVEYWIAKSEFNNVVSHRNEIEVRLEEYKAQVDVQFLANIYLDFSIAFFALGEFDKALDQLNSLTEMKEYKQLMNLNFTVRILSAIFHFEAGNQFFVQNMLNNYSYYFRKNKILNEFERDVIHLLDKLCETTSGKQKREVFGKYLPVFEENQKRINYHYVLGSFDLLRYVRSGSQQVAYKLVR